MAYQKMEGMRPVNMRCTHGLRVVHDVSAAKVVEGKLADPLCVRESGSGMDAPDDLPTGSVKAFFTDTNGNKVFNVVFGFCQRTTSRGRRS